MLTSYSLYQITAHKRQQTTNGMSFCKDLKLHNNIQPIRTTTSNLSGQQHPTYQDNNIQPIRTTTSNLSGQQHPTYQDNNIQPIRTTTSNLSGQQHPTYQDNNIQPIRTTTSNLSGQQHPTYQDWSIEWYVFLPAGGTTCIPLTPTTDARGRSTWWHECLHFWSIKPSCIPVFKLTWTEVPSHSNWLDFAWEPGPGEEG